MNITSIMIVGVGGQGTLLASRILGNTLNGAGYDLKVTQVRGMNQRRGSETTCVRFGEKVWSPIIEKGGADIILSFELLEALRALPYLKRDGQIIVNAQQIDPMPVITGAAEYPKGIEEALREHAKLTAVDALALAREAGSIKAVNVVLIGLLARNTSIPREQWEETLRTTVPPKFLDINMKAFELGYQYEE